MYSEAIK